MPKKGGEMRPTSELRGPGMYMIDNFDASAIDSSFATALEVLGHPYRNGNVYPDPELRVLLAHNAKFDVIEATYLLTNSEETRRRCFIGRAFISEKLFFGRTIAVLNSSFVGNRDWAPKAHPNDGRLDLVELDGSMNVRQRLTALKLMKSGSHLPHPQIRYRQLSEYEYATEDSASLSIEGVRMGSIRHCLFRVLPDAVNLYW